MKHSPNIRQLNVFCTLAMPLIILGCLILFFTACDNTGLEDESTQKIELSENEFAEYVKIMPLSYWQEDNESTRLGGDSIPDPLYGHRFRYSHDDKYLSILIELETGHDYPLCYGWGICLFYCEVTEFENGDNPSAGGNRTPLMCQGDHYYIDILLAHPIGDISTIYPLIVSSDITTTIFPSPNIENTMEITIVQGSYRYNPNLGLYGGYRVDAELVEYK